jgi:beta-N-acetylhexosaminidase
MLVARGRTVLTRWRLIGLAGCLAALVLALVLAVGGRGDGGAVPEGGSSFGAPPPRHHHAGTGLLDALAPVLPPGGRGAAPVAKAATAGDDAPALPATAPRAAARLFLVGFGGPDPGRDVLRRLALHEWGGVILEAGNGISAQQVAGLVGRVRGAAQHARHLAPLIVASQPGGDGDAVPVGTPLQSQIADAGAARRTARATARALRALGIRMVLGPDADTGTAGGPWAGRAYSDDPALVGQLAAAGVAGYEDGGVAPAPGHFPGEGAASGDPALDPATVGLSADELRARDLKPFAALAPRAPAIQLSAATYVAFDGVTPATLLPEVVTLLRKDLGFGGVVVSGDLAAASLASGRPVADLAVEALKAGCDLLWVPGDAGDQDAAWRAVVGALRTGEVAPERVAEALGRVSALRARYGVK